MAQRPIRRIVPNEQFARARTHNALHPEPSCLEVVCGDPCCLVTPNQPVRRCLNCLQPFKAKRNEARSMQVCLHDPTMALSRRQEPLGVVCSLRCSQSVWARFLHYYEAEHEDVA